VSDAEIGLTQSDFDLIMSWQMAYRAANKKRPPDVSVLNGWFTIDGVEYRRKQLEEMSNRLSGVAPDDLRSKESK
jgi:hypothetical protein